MKKLHLLVVKSYIGPLILTFFIAEFVLIMHFLWLYIGDLVGKGLEWSIILELLLYASAGLVKMALPLAILLASIMTFGNFGEHFELSAMKSAGISLQRIMFPLIVFSVLISIGSFFFSNNVIPYTNLKMGSLLYDIGNQQPETNIKPGVFNTDVEDFSIKIKGKSPTSNMMYDFMVYDHRDKRGNPKVTLADSGTIEITPNQKYTVITLYGGKSYEEMKEGRTGKKNYPENHSYFNKQIITFEIDRTGMDERTDENLFKHHYHMKTINELQKSKDSLSLRLNRRKQQFVTGLNRSRYFKFERKNSNLKDTLYHKKDSIKKLTRPEELKTVIDVDSLFNTYDNQRKDMVIKTTLDNIDKTLSYISSNQKDIYERQKNIHKHEIAWHEKFTLSFACLIFFFIGAPLGAIIRKGGFGLPFLVSVIFFLLYYVISLMGRKFVEEGAMEPWQGMWISSLLTLPLGILFTYKATTDSVLFDIGTYIEFLKRPFKVMKIEYKDPFVVFHKDVELPNGQIILRSIQNTINASIKLREELDYNLRQRRLDYRVDNEQDFKDYIESYDSLFNILSVKFREKNYLKIILDKFPKIEYEQYVLNAKIIIKNTLMSILIVLLPIGLLYALRSYLKFKTLMQKLEAIEQNMTTIKDMVKHKLTEENATN